MLGADSPQQPHQRGFSVVDLVVGSALVLAVFWLWRSDPPWKGSGRTGGKFLASDFWLVGFCAILLGLHLPKRKEVGKMLLAVTNNVILGIAYPHNFLVTWF